MKLKKLLIFNLIPVVIVALYVGVSIDAVVSGFLITLMMMAYWSLGGIYLAIANSLILGKNIKALVFSLGVLWGITGIYCGLWSLLGMKTDSFGNSILLFLTVCQSVSLLITWSIMVIHNKLKQRKTEKTEKQKSKSKKIIIILNLLPIFFSIIRTLYVVISRKIFIFYPLFIFPFEAFYFLLGGIYYTIVNYRLVKKIGKKAFAFSCLSIVLFQIFNLLASYAEKSIEIFAVTTIYQWLTFVISWGICSILYLRKAKKALTETTIAEETEN